MLSDEGRRVSQIVVLVLFDVLASVSGLLGDRALMWPLVGTDGGTLAQIFVEHNALFKPLKATSNTIIHIS